MINHLPLWINVLFMLAFVLSMVFFYLSNGKHKKLVMLLVLWSALQSGLAYSGFYLVTDSFPPRFGLVLIPAAIFIVYGLLPKQRTWVFENRNTILSTFLHVVRFPVELVLHGLFIHKMVPELMTYEGRNFDILIGITAPLVGWLFLKKKFNKKILLVWNIIGLILVSFILINGILSAELPFQQFGFEQPNRGINYFPFILLPAVIVPLVIWTHITDILKLRSDLKKKN